MAAASASQRLVTEASLKNLGSNPSAKVSAKKLTVSAYEKNADGSYGTTAVTTELGNTLVRNITSLCNNIVSGTVELIRSGQTVQISLNAVKVSTGLGPGGITIIAGTGQASDPLFSYYRTGFYNDVSAVVAKSNGPNVGRIAMNRNGGVSLYGIVDTDTVYGSIMTITDRSWPDTLIGV